MDGMINMKDKKLRIQGRLSVEIDTINENKNKVIFSLSPLSKYLSPDGKYGVCYNKEKVNCLKLNDHKLVLESDLNTENTAHLIYIAMQQQNIELFLEKKSSKITGFKYPCEKI